MNGTLTDVHSLNIEGNFAEIFNVKSKRKRIRKKMYKKAVAHVMETQQLHAEKEMEVREEDNTSSKTSEKAVSKSSKQITKETALSFNALPVTFLLKLGKQYLGNLDVVRYYYKSTETPFYKNRELLEATLEKEARNLSESLQTEFWNSVEEEKKKKSKHA